MEPGVVKSPVTQLRRGVLEFCVLALLAERETYAIDLVRRLARVEGLATTEGTIYPLLSRLRRDGVVVTTWQESPSGPPRRYYAITDVGRASLLSFRAEWRSFVDGVENVMAEGARSGQ